MIAANEVRLGNLVKAPLGEILKVKQIGHPDNPYYILAENENGFGQNGFEGIELTPEILEKAGFEKREGYDHYADSGVYVKIGWHNSFQIGYELDYDRLVHLQTIHFFHELQNFFFCITNAEISL